nr:MAG TPA: hypothetical protein [Caudoviricetes sp.]
MGKRLFSLISTWFRNGRSESAGDSFTVSPALLFLSGGVSMCP